MNSSANALTWYEDKQLQLHRKHWFFGKAVPLISAFDRLPAFQVSKAKDAIPVSEVLLISFDESSSTDITTKIQTAGLSLIETDNFDIISYPDTVNLGISGLTVGLYYLQMTDGSNTWYSEIFQFCRSVDDFIKIEYWHRETFCHNEGEFVFEYPYKNRVYIDSDIGRPSYPYDETVKKNNGVNFPLHQTSYKQYKFTAILTEAVLDALRLIGLHDDVVITYGGQTYLVNEFLMTNPSWDDRGDVAETIFEFRTNTVVNVHGRAVDTVAYEGEDGACLVATIEAVAEVEFPSDDYTNFEYVTRTGNVGNLAIGEKIVKLNGSIRTVEEYNGASYDVVAVSSGDVVYSYANDEYYGGAGSNTVVLPAVLFYNTGTNTMSAFALDGAAHTLYAIVNGSAPVLGTYTAAEIVELVIVLPEGTTHLRMDVGSVACGTFFTTADYEIPVVPVTLYEDIYPNETDAITGGVAQCELYRIEQGNNYGLVSPGSCLLLLYPGVGCNTAYDNEADAIAGGLTDGDVYPVTLANDYGIASAGGRGIAVVMGAGNLDDFPGPFSSHAEAAANGVVVNQAYIASADHDQGVISANNVPIVRSI